jgi:hypothetical protein
MINMHQYSIIMSRLLHMDSVTTLNEFDQDAAIGQRKVIVAKDMSGLVDPVAIAVAHPVRQLVESVCMFLGNVVRPLPLGYEKPWLFRQARGQSRATHAKQLFAMRDTRPRPHDLQVMDDRRISSVSAVGELLSASCVHHDHLSLYGRSLVSGQN